MDRESRSRRQFLGAAATLATGIAARAVSLERDAQLPQNAQVLVVEDQPGETPTLKWKAAIRRAINEGPGRYNRILGTAAAYELDETIDVSGLQHVAIAGMGARRTVFSSRRPDGALDAVFSNTTATSGSGPVTSVSFEDFSVLGGMIDLTAAEKVERLRDDRPWPARDAGVLRAAVKLIGGRGLASGPEVQDIDITRVHVYGTKELPVIVFRAAGKVRVSHCRFERCKDVGFTFNEYVSFCDNTVLYSADNGVSISRGNEGGQCLRNKIYHSYYSGILVGGNIGTAERGPLNVKVARNVISGAGSYGIDLTLAPRDITVTENEITNAHLGIAVCGWVFDKAATYSRGSKDFTWSSDYVADAIAITKNRITDSTRGGIAIYHARNIVVEHNTIHFSMHTGHLRRNAVIGRDLYGVSNQGQDASDRATSSAVSIRSNEITEERRAEGITDGVFYQGAADWSVGQNTITGAVRLT